MTFCARKARINLFAPIVVAAIGLFGIAGPARAATRTLTLSISVGGRPIHDTTPGTRVEVSVRPWPRWRDGHAFCVGLASVVDRYGLPVSLGRVVREGGQLGHVSTIIPRRLIPAEPAGPFMIFVGRCNPIAPDRPFEAGTLISITA